ncbi:MAG: AbrB family transcriptional regulator [Rariglobus sp.]|jgi:AbrB family looped-hinge helix DNA binding protein|nr:AbrB family transcriptional regulator [Rariglobus sp.]
MKLTTKGQVTIPLKLRKRYGLAARTEVTFEAAEGGVLIKPASAPRLQRLKTALRRARGSATSGLTTGDIMRQTRGE